MGAAWEARGAGASARRPRRPANGSCGFKWLCGPYATGFVWLSPRVLDALDHPNPHWLRLQLAAAARAGVDLTRSLDYTLVDEPTAGAHDVFCAANFLGFMTWTASVEHLLDVGVDRIEAHDQALVDELLAGLPGGITLESPEGGPERSTLVLLGHPQAAEAANELALRGVDVALRGGKVRLSPHLYNSSADIEAAVGVLSERTRSARTGA